MQMSEETKQNVEVVPNGAVENKEKDEQGEEKMFTQSQLEEIISERLSRERKTNDSLMSVKRLLKTASEKGVLKTSSYAEMAKELAERLSLSTADTQKDGTTKNGQDGNIQNITVEDENNSVLSDEARNEFSGADENENSNAEKESGTDEAEDNMTSSFVKMLSAIKAKNSPKNVEKLFTGNLFESFAKGRRGSVDEIFDDFCEFMSAMAPQESEPLRDEDASYYASTAFSAHSGANTNNFGLTKQQMEIANGAGMSYREYASLLEAIPSKEEKQL